MKFAVSSSELLSGLMSVSKVIVPKPTNSILENFLFQLEGNTLTVTASDGETTLKTTVEIAQVSQEGATAVPAKLLTDSLKEFPDQPLAFSVDGGQIMTSHDGCFSSRRFSRSSIRVWASSKSRFIFQLPATILFLFMI